MTEDPSPEKLRKFLESDDPALVMMGLSMAKAVGSTLAGMPEELLPTILGLYMWDDDKSVRTAARTMFFKDAPAEIQATVKENWKPSYRTLSISGDRFPRSVRPFVQAFKSQDDFAEIALMPLIKALEDDSFLVRAEAMKALGKIGDARTVEPLIEALGDERYSVRDAAAIALGEIGDVRAVEPLIKELAARRGQDWALEHVGGALRKFGIQGLQGFITAGKGGGLTVSELKTILKEDGLSVSGTKAQLIQRLTKFKVDAKKSTEKITEKNAEKLLKSENPAMIQKGLSMVKRDGVPEELLPSILGLYMWNDDNSVRAAAKSVFNKYAPAEMVKVKENWKPSYRTLLITGDRFPEAVHPFLEAFKSQDDFAGIALEPLIGMLSDDDWKVRMSAAGPLGKIGDIRAVEALIEALLDDDRGVCGEAASALGKIGDVRAVEPLIKALDYNRDNSDWGWSITRSDITEALGRIGDVRAVEPILHELEITMKLKSRRDHIEMYGSEEEKDEDEDGSFYYIDPDTGVRTSENTCVESEMAVDALGEIGDKRAVKLLIKVFEKGGNLAVDAAKALGKIGDVRAVEPLEDAGFKVCALWILRDVTKLIKALEDEDEWAAAEALGEIGDPRAVEPLTKALGDDKSWVRTAAEEALRKLGHEVE